ncbi:MAG: hypothetical protein N2316_13715 [Spirochaetes bacterium]|nr:hypothetical protein [Spirochaetota bacterium]
MGIEFFYKSNVWWTLVAMGFFFAPMLVYGMIRGVREGMLVEPSIKDKLPSPIRILVVFFSMQWVVCLGLAVVATVIVINVGNALGHIGWGYVVGLPAIALLYFVVLFRKEGIMNRIVRMLYIEE